MSTEPDPQLVREIAREHIRSGRSDIGITIELMLIGTILSREALAAWEGAVRQAILAATVEWPDEQAQADVRPDRITAGELAEVIGRHPGWRDLPVLLLAMHDDAVWLNEIERDCFDVNEGPVLSLIAHAPAVAEPLASPRAAEQAQAECDADARAVAALLEVAEDVLKGTKHRTAIRDTGQALAARFADRIAALDARTTDGGAKCPCGCPVVADMCSCPEPCPCEPDCAYCLTPNPMRQQDR